MEDAKRCAAAGVPAAARQAKSKSQLALAMVRHHRQLGVRFSRVGMVGGHGKEPALLFMLQERLAARDTYPLLSCTDVETLLAYVLPRRDVELPEAIRQLEVRHTRRSVS